MKAFQIDPEKLGKLKLKNALESCLYMVAAFVTIYFICGFSTTFEFANKLASSLWLIPLLATFLVFLVGYNTKNFLINTTYVIGDDFVAEVLNKDGLTGYELMSANRVERKYGVLHNIELPIKYVKKIEILNSGIKIKANRASGLSNKNNWINIPAEIQNYPEAQGLIRQVISNYPKIKVKDNCR